MNVFIIRNAEYRTNASMQRIVTALHSMNHNCYIISRNRDGESKRDQASCLDKRKKIIEVNVKSEYGKNLIGLLNIFRYQIEIIKILMTNRGKIDFVHVIDLDAALPVLLFAKIMKIKYLYHIADFYADSRGVKNKVVNKFLRKLEFLVINNSETTFICTEERTKQILGSKPKRLEVVHNVPIISSGYHCDNVISDILKFAYVGSLHEKRFIKQIIRSFASSPDIELHIAGMGNMEEYVEDAAKKYANIHYYGVVNYEKAMEIYRDTNIIIGMYDPNIKNHEFAAPNKVYESINLCRPIVYTAGIGLSDLVEKNDFGWLVEYDQSSFGQLIRSISCEKVVAKSKNAERIREDYSWGRIKQKIASVYSALESQ